MRGLKLAPAWRRPARLALLALLALNVALAAGFTVPRGLAQRRLDDRVAGLKAERAVALARQQALREREELLARNQRDATQLTERLIGTREETLVSVLEELDAAGRELNLRFGPRSLSPGDVKGVAITRVRISLPVEGSYRELVTFVRRLEHSRRFLSVDELRLSEREGGQRASLEVRVSAYFRGEYERPRVTGASS